MVKILFKYEGVKFKRKTKQSKMNLESFILYPTREFFRNVSVIKRNEEKKGEMIIEIEFIPFGTAYYFHRTKRILLPIVCLTSRARTACVAYHEFYHSHQFRRIKKDVELEKELIAELEIEAHQKTIEYALKLPENMWSDKYEKEDLIECFKEELKEYRRTRRL